VWRCSREILRESTGDRIRPLRSNPAIRRPGLRAKMMMLVNRETGKGFGVTLFESEGRTCAAAVGPSAR
jgi:hypothetical protein